MNRKCLTIFSFILVVSVVLSVVPALATEFEIGTQFGISQIASTDDDDTHLTSTQIPSAAFSIGSLSDFTVYHVVSH